MFISHSIFIQKNIMTFKDNFIYAFFTIRFNEMKKMKDSIVE